MTTSLLHLIIGGTLGALATLLFKQPNIGIAVGTAFGFIRQIQEIETKGFKVFPEFIAAVLGSLIGSSAINMML